MHRTWIVTATLLTAVSTACNPPASAAELELEPQDTFDVTSDGITDGGLFPCGDDEDATDADEPLDALEPLIGPQALHFAPEDLSLDHVLIATRKIVAELEARDIDGVMLASSRPLIR